MKQFLIRIALFVPFIVAAFYTKPLYLLIDNRYQQSVAGKEIYYALKKSKKYAGSKKILLGDSVARQFFDCFDEGKPINSLATNQAISMAGQYILLHNYLEAGNRFDTLILLFNPFTLSNNLDQVYTYHYFIKPFYTPENEPLLSDIVVTQVKKIPFYWLAREPYILTSNWAPDIKKNDAVRVDNPKPVFLSAISKDYLNKIQQLGDTYHFSILIIPTPVNKKFRQDVDDLAKNYLDENDGLSNLFKNYFNDISFLDSSEFEDEIHLYTPKKHLHLLKIEQ